MELILNKEEQEYFENKTKQIADSLKESPVKEEVLKDIRENIGSPLLLKDLNCLENISLEIQNPLAIRAAQMAILISKQALLKHFEPLN